MQIDAIDWHDFVVVERIDLYDDEEMKKEDEDQKVQEDADLQKQAEKKQEIIKMQIEEI